MTRMAISPLLATRTLVNTGRGGYRRVDNREVIRGGAGFAALVVVLVLPASAYADLPFRQCKTGMPCARLAVPLDRSGAQPGQVSLYVERRRAMRRPRTGVTVLLAGGPGQPATGAFSGFLPGDSYREFGVLMPRHDIVAFDARG